MGHKPTREELVAAFERYKAITGDRDAVLSRRGAYWVLDGRFRIIEAFGREGMHYALGCFCDGWEGGARQAEEFAEERERQREEALRERP